MEPTPTAATPRLLQPVVDIYALERRHVKGPHRMRQYAYAAVLYAVRRLSLAAAVLLLAACGTGEDTPRAIGEPLADESSATGTAPAEPVTPQVFPDVLVPTVSGGQIDFGALHGTDTVLWFWAPW